MDPSFPSSPPGLPRLLPIPLPPVNTVYVTERREDYTHPEGSLLFSAPDIGTTDAIGPVRRRVRRGGRHRTRPARNGGRAHQSRDTSSPYPYPVVRPEVLYRYPPLTASPGVVCTLEQVDQCGDVLLELIGWGVPLEYITDSGLSLPGAIWLYAKLRLCLPWAIITRALEDRIPFHPSSRFPRGYHPAYYPPLI
ncbi:hypothetical protein P691DRAFT_771550 [Macrolepiota fuliginosa MF-IS2]|uniref:Uncharacterized protein n=1 Tax=Macrolepiota fuliginosa MF-IS2 TaxID=1400762 RepID=A0A9P5XMB8_9AGAR|nr:hypothetical protein P691DRAFT_771550 [Macrolepiota fuliginosa MF-IS2]